MSDLIIHADVETRSTVDLRKTGAHIYFAHPSTTVVLMCYSIGDGDVKSWRMGQPCPADFAGAVAQGAIVHAWNAPFERLAFEMLAAREGWPAIPFDNFSCTMARGRAAGLPGSLDGALRAMGANIEKDKAGHALMLRLCRPRSVAPDGAVTWWEDQERFDRLEKYCQDDVRAERWLDRKLPQLQPAEKIVWQADQRLNARGVPLDLEFLQEAQRVAAIARKDLDRQMSSITGGWVPKASNVSKLRTWLNVQASEVDPLSDEDDDEEDAIPELRKADVVALLQRFDPGTPQHRALTVRLEAGKSSVKKVDAMLGKVAPDRRARQSLMYYGAHTGRWAATGGVQFQNLPRDGVKDWNRCRRLLEGDPEVLDILEGPPLDIISRMLRGSIAVPPNEDGTLVWADYSSVEARGVAWLAGQDDLVEAFRSGAKIYEDMAASVFGIPADQIGKESFERFVGKGLVLGAGYQMGGAKFAVTCAKQGRPIDEDFAFDAIGAYRDRFPKIKRLWLDMEDAAIAAVKKPGETFQIPNGKVRFSVRNGWLIMRLPTGSFIRYRSPRMVHDNDERYDRDVLAYDGVNSLTKKWGEQKTYGGRLTENAVQRICRDIVASSLVPLEDAGYLPILLVHDEIITITSRPDASPREVEEIMCRVPPGLEGFPIAAEGKIGRRYSK
jgi:DNA polymerase